MTTIVSRREVEGCLDRVRSYEYELSNELDEALMNAIGRDSLLRYYPQFPRPYFRIERNQAWVIQGILGDTKVRVTFTTETIKDLEADLRARIEGPAGETLAPGEV